MSRVMVVAGYTPSLINFRGELLRLFVRKGHEVFTLGPEFDSVIQKELKKIGVFFDKYHLIRSGVGVIDDFKTFFSLIGQLRYRKPDVVLAYTIKPVIWTGIASLFTSSFRFYALITGLGYVFEKKSGFRKILFYLVIGLYKLALLRSSAVIFQNVDNRNVFVQLGIVDIRKTHVVNGSGVDLEKFVHAPKDVDSNCIEFLSVGRLLGAKGFREYFEAAKIVKSKHSNARFTLVGPLDPSPDGITKNEVENWCDSGVINYVGESDDVLSRIKECDVYVLPSYHEGMPRTVLEAMAVGRPILTTNVPGCKETVDDYVNGILVEKQDIDGLVCAIEWYLQNSWRIPEMGRSSRKICKAMFDVHVVNSEMVEVMGL